MVCFDATVTHFRPSGTLYAAWGRLGVSLWNVERFWGYFGTPCANLEMSVGYFGSSWGASGGCLGGILRYLRFVLGDLGWYVSL